MRRRDIQSFGLKLNDMKEYEAVRLERLAARAQAEAAAAAGRSDLMATDTETPIGQTKVGGQQQPPPLVKYGPKSKQEIRERLGLTDT